MKKNRMIIHLLPVWVMLLVMLIASTALGQYELTWSTIDGGGCGGFVGGDILGQG
ncbi:MAG: hypothetical protein ACYSWZ_11355 [Planctomycetota bacterium]|jgi:hypothetical protein